jgi:hypothetical protein
MNQQLDFPSIPPAGRPLRVRRQLDTRTRAIGIVGVARARAELHRHPRIEYPSDTDRCTTHDRESDRMAPTAKPPSRAAVEAPDHPAPMQPSAT